MVSDWRAGRKWASGRYRCAARGAWPTRTRGGSVLKFWITPNKELFHMKLIISLAALAATAVWAQAPAASSQSPAAAAAAAAKAAVEKPQSQAAPAASPQAPAKPPAAQPSVNVLTLPPDKIVATVDGNKITVGDLQTLLSPVPPQVQQQLLRNPQVLFERYGLMRRLAEQAVEAKLDQTSPVKGKLESTRMQVLAQAMVDQKSNGFKTTPDEEKKYYESKKDQYAQAKVKAIYIPFSTAANPPADDKGKKPLTEAEAKTKADGLVKQIRGGADFVKLVKENSGDAGSAAKDGDFGTIHRTDPLPEPMKSAVLTTKPGEITEPLRQAAGFYIFRVEEVGTQPFAEVQERIAKELEGEKFREWMDSVRKSIDIKLESGVFTTPSQPLSPVPTVK